MSFGVLMMPSVRLKAKALFQKRRGRHHDGVRNAVVDEGDGDFVGDPVRGSE